MLIARSRHALLCALALGALACVVHAAANGPEPGTGTLSSSSSSSSSGSDGSSDAAFSFDARNIIALSVAALVASLAASAGVGGGAFFVPLFMVVLGLALKQATVMSQCSIAAVSLASIAFNLPKRHPKRPDTTLINYELLLTMTPALLMGVTVGVIFNVAFPTWLITTMLLALLVFMCTRTTQKGSSQWRSETLAQQQAREAATLAAAAPPAAAGGSQSAGSAAAAAVVVIADTPAAADKPRSQPYPWAELLGVVFLWLGFGGLAVLRQQTQKCSMPYFAVLAAQLSFGASCSALFAYLCVARPARRRAAAAAEGLSAPLLGGSSSGSSGRLLEEHTEQLMLQHQSSMWHLMINAAWVALAGTVAGIVGVGGGMLMAPMLLDAGVHPVSASATSNILVFMASSSAALTFFLDGRVQLASAGVYCAVCGLASLAGLTLVGRLVTASGRPSIVVLLLAFIMGAGAVCSGVFGYWDAWDQAQAGQGSGFKSIC